MVVTQDQGVNVLWRVQGVAQELFLADVGEFADEVRASLWTHDAVTEGAHSLVTEDVSESVFLPATTRRQ